MTGTAGENFYLRGNFAPVEEEVSAADLPVTGVLPRELNGRYLRIGPNLRTPVDTATYHWFTGPGMVHGIRLRDGRAEWYRSRFVQGGDGAPVDGGPPKSNADGAPNTNVFCHGGRILAVDEGGRAPIQLTPDLGGMAVWDCDGALGRGFAPHPKTDPETGDLHAVTYHTESATVRHLVLDRDGTATHTTDIAVDDVPLMHDMALTRTRVIVFDLPVTPAAGLRRARSGNAPTNLPMMWDEQHPSRIGLLPIGAAGDRIQWIDVPRCFVFHVLNAYDDPDGSVTLDVVRYDAVFRTDMNGPGDTVPKLVRWTVNPATGTTDEQTICSYGVEFPRIDASLTGRRHRYGWFAGVGEHGVAITDDVERRYTRDGFETGPLVKVDTVTGRSEISHYGPGRVTMEPEFVPRPGAQEEDDGWIMSVVHDGNTDRAELVILDAADITAAPIARVHLPNRVPFGFHGNWVDDRDIA
ncbi:carotenoid oxygenase family protein [Streptomyces sp. NPDC088729]|uniref:carotenoid oxygenase family protein n=1 Tax=Streptomyces sp. NPDC088729 TaxID=3365876 RepID=UPI003822E74A